MLSWAIGNTYAKEEPMAKVLSTRQAARELNLAPTTVRRLVKTGELPGRQVGHKVLIPTEAVERIVRGEPAKDGGDNGDD